MPVYDSQRAVAWIFLEDICFIGGPSGNCKVNLKEIIVLVCIYLLELEHPLHTKHMQANMMVLMHPWTMGPISIWMSLLITSITPLSHFILLSRCWWCIFIACQCGNRSESNLKISRLLVPDWIDSFNIMCTRYTAFGPFASFMRRAVLVSI